MRIVQQANQEPPKLSMSKAEWLRIGQNAGWIEKKANVIAQLPATIVVVGGAVPANTYPFGLTLECNGLEIYLNPQDGHLKELFEQVTIDMQSKTKPGGGAPWGIKA